MADQDNVAAWQRKACCRKNSEKQIPEKKKDRLWIFGKKKAHEGKERDFKLHRMSVIYLSKLMSYCLLGDSQGENSEYKCMLHASADA